MCELNLCGQTPDLKLQSNTGSFQHQVEIAAAVMRHEVLQREVKELHKEFLDIKDLLQEILLITTISC